MISLQLNLKFRIKRGHNKMMAPSLLNCIVEEAYSSPLLHGKVALIREVASLEGGQFISILLSQHLKSGLIRGVVFGRRGIIRWVASLESGEGTIYKYSTISASEIWSYKRCDL
jgi:hypothetical protein